MGKRMLVALLVLVVVLVVIISLYIFRTNPQTLSFSQLDSFSQPWDRLKGPLSLDLSDGKVVYLADTGNRRILKYNLAGKGLQEIKGPELGYPVAVAVADDHIFVSDLTKLSIWIYNRRGQLTGRIPNTQDEQQIGSIKPFALAVDESKNLYVADSNKRRIIKLKFDGTYLGELKTPGINGLWSVNALQIRQKEHKLYALDTGSRALFTFDLSTGSLSDTFYFPNYLPAPRGMAINADDGSAYISDMLANTVYKLNLTDKSLSLVIAGGMFNHPVSLSLISKTLLVVDKDNNRVLSFKVE